MAPEPVNITTAELAARLRVDPSTVRRWVETGKLKPSFTTPGGHHRFNETQVHEQLGKR
ncbi:helix-turn-helix domain-containing protein [Microbacterium sp. KNMS]